MNTKTLIAVLSLFALPVQAAITVPTVAGIPEGATAAQFIVYFFNLAVAVGAFIAVVIIVMAGIEWMTSEGSPSKIESAKSKIKNTLLGIVVLFGCYLILNIINPELSNIKINQLYCSQGIAVMSKTSQESTEASKKTCITNTSANLGYIESTLSWDFPGDTLLSVYTYPGVNYTGTKTEYSCENGGCSGNFANIAGAKSIYFVWKSPGLYLYDQAGFKSGSKFPLLLTASTPNLGDKDFDNIASSIKVNNPDPTKENKFYEAVIFDGPNYTGQCSFLTQSNSDLNSTMVKNGKMSSIVITKASYDQKVYSDAGGYVTLYNKPDCPEETSTEVKKCNITSFGRQPIPGNCDPNVMSLSITGRYGIVVISDKGECRYYDSSNLDRGVCQSKMPTAIYDPAGTVTAGVIMFPVDKK